MAARHDLAMRPVTALGVIEPPPILVQTPAFDGSLGTLLAFVRDHRVDLIEVPLLPICESYFTYMLSAGADRLDEAAAALAALAYLLERKAWRLLPVPDPEPEFEEALESFDPSVHEYADVIEVLRVWHEERSMLYFRAPEAGPNPYELPYTFGNVQANDLTRALERLLRKAEPPQIEPLSKPRRSLAEQMRVVLASMDEQWRRLEALIQFPFTREDAVYWFLSLLELVRLGKVRARLCEAVDGGIDVEFARA